MTHEYLTRDHPEADGRKPKDGEHAWTLTLPLECGETLTLRIGEQGREAILNCLMRDLLTTAED